MSYPLQEYQQRFLFFTPFSVLLQRKNPLSVTCSGVAVWGECPAETRVPSTFPALGNSSRTPSKATYQLAAMLRQTFPCATTQEPAKRP